MNPGSFLPVSALLIICLAACGGGGGGSSAVDEPAKVSAYVYDDFSGTGVDASKWTVSKGSVSDPDFFPQTDGRLNFQVTAGSASLVSARAFDPGFYSIQFSDFTSTNIEEPGSHRGAFVGLGLGTRDNYVRIIRCQNGHKDSATGVISYYQVFEAIYVSGKTSSSDGIQVYVHTTTVDSGQLGLYYDGSKVTFYYNPDPTADTGWKTIRTDNGDNGAVLQWDPHQEPGWSDPAYLFLSGNDVSGATSFKLDNLRYRPDPPQ